MGEKMLSPKQINQYSDNGFTVKRGMISKNDISKLLVEIDRIVGESTASHLIQTLLKWNQIKTILEDW